MRRATLLLAVGVFAVLPSGCLVGDCPGPGTPPSLAGTYASYEDAAEPEATADVTDESVVVEYTSTDGHRYRARYRVVATDSHP